jgi:NAD(P)-dependent dehydrogenase (short-subunit alcohol dehydrogenase family)
MIMSAQNRVALVTGVSNGGTGYTTSVMLAQNGWKVYAGARHVQAVSQLQEYGVHVIPLDVTDESSMVSAVQSIEAKHGAVDALVNNAAYGEMGAVEEVTMDRIRKQFETNVFGLVRMIQLVLPGMRRQSRGRIINVSSMGGEFTTPFASFYHASKYAVESISDGLRMEVQPFGIDVVVVQPGGIRTGLATKTLEAIPTGEGSAYGVNLQAMRQVSFAVASMPQVMVTPEQVAAVIVEAIQADSPLTRYKITTADMHEVNQQRNVADRQRDAALVQQFGMTTSLKTESR